ncbi:MAG: class I SAM-dependent methyltransferase [Candidatus Nanosalina sp.]
MTDREEKQEERIREAEPYEGYWEESYGFVFKKLQELVSGRDFSRALEFGCGRGEFFERYARSFDEVIAIERDWNKRDKAMEEAYWNDMKHIRFKSSEEDGEPLEKESFDMVLVGQPLRHMSGSEAEDTVQKSRELLRSGGLLVLLAPHLKKGQERFLETKRTEEGNFSTEAVSEEDFEDKKDQDGPEMLIQRFRSEDFAQENLRILETFYYHDTILPGFLDRIASRDRIINLPFLKGFFGSEMMVVLKKE